MFVVCGEALFDVFATGDTPTGMALDARVGGSPFNVAVGLARLAQPVSLLTQVSRGFLGERLMRALQAEGVGTSAVQRSDAPTTLSLVGLDAAGVPSYAFYGHGCADRLLGLDALPALPAGVQAIHFGSYATVTGQTAATQRALAEQARHQALISYDPNVRLNVEPELAVWREQVAWMLPRTHLLKVSEEDLGLIHPGLPLEAFAADALARGVACVVVTRGSEGAVAWQAGGRVDAAPVAVRVVDTVGAGDTFQAALLTWLAEHDALTAAALAALPAQGLAQALAFASQAAAITCSRRGADLPRRAELPAPARRAGARTAPPVPPHIAGFWHAFCAAVPGDHDAHFLEAFAFGDSQALADELAALVLAGTKRATAASLPGMLAEGKRLPQAGDLSVVTDWAGQPLCVIRTTQVDIVPFDDVSAEFAAVEGEGDGSLTYWHSAHTAFFSREAAREGYVFDGRMPVCCERFQVIYPLLRTTAAQP